MDLQHRTCFSPRTPPTSLSKQIWQRGGFLFVADTNMHAFAEDMNNPNKRTNIPSLPSPPHKS